MVTTLKAAVGIGIITSLFLVGLFAMATPTYAASFGGSLELIATKLNLIEKVVTALTHLRATQVAQVQTAVSSRTNPVTISGFTVSATSVTAGQSVTFTWTSNVTSTDVSSFGGGCKIMGPSASDYVTNGYVSGSGSVVYRPTATATYTLTCTSGTGDDAPKATKQVRVTVVAQTQTVSTATTTTVVTPVIAVGRYVGYMNGSVFIETLGITEAAALQNCKTNASANPNSSIKCTWNGKTIHEVAVMEKGIYALWADDTLVVDEDGITKADALKRCKAYIKKNPEPAVVCTWGPTGAVFYQVPGTNPAQDEVIFKTSETNPDGMTIDVSASESSDWTSIFAFDMDSDDSQHDIEIHSLFVKLQSPSKEPINDLLYDARINVAGHIYDDYTKVGGTGATANLTFDIDGEEVMEPGDRFTAELQLRFKAQSGNYDNGDTIVASADGTMSTFEADDDLVGEGSVKGATHTLSGAGIEVAWDWSDEELDTMNDAIITDDAGVFTITFEVTASADDIWINKTASRGTAMGSGGVSYVVTNSSGKAQTAGSASASLSSTADTDGGRYIVREGESETFTLTVIYDPKTAGMYGVRLHSVNFANSNTNPNEQWPVSPAADFETDSLAI